MIARRHIRLVYLLAALLLFSTLVPCGLIDQATASACAEAASAKDSACEAKILDTRMKGAAIATAEADHCDCCAACLTCCPNYVPACAPATHHPAHAAQEASLALADTPLASPHPIWHPPRR